MKELFVQFDDNGDLLCARCGEEKAGPFYRLVKAPSESFTVAFCTPFCRTAFVQGFNASQSLKES